MSKKKLIIGGDSSFAEIAYEYFQEDSPYQVVAFTVEKEFLRKESLFGLPIYPLEEIEKNLPPQEHFFYAALVYTQLNRLRTRFYQTLKNKGYRPASYISSHSFIWKNVEIGDNCFIFEDNTVQPFVKIGNNVVLWSGNHIGHHSIIEENCFISSHVVISGHCHIKKNCFFGVNATIGNNVTIEEDCLIGAGTLVTKDVQEDTLVKGQVSSAASISSKRFFKVKE